MNEPRLLIFARVPEPGQVKRRLAAAIGVNAACAAHDTLVRDTLARLACVPGITSELWLDAPPNETAQAWLVDYPLPLRRQQGDDLGARMLHALRASLVQTDRVVLVGSDCPDLDAGYVAGAAERLQTSDVVLGPAEDGGYALIGARRRSLPLLAGLFAGVTWGRDTVLAQTLTRVRAADLEVTLLDTVWDVDDETGWQRYLARGGRP